jgi:prophage tail gpP-like protein
MPANTAPDFALRIDGTPWKVWTDISLTRAIDRMSGEFRVSFGMNREEGAISLDGGLKTGSVVDVEIDGAVVLSGYSRVIDYQYDAFNSAISVSGHDKTIDLMDCAASVDGPFEFSNATLLAVIKRIVAPFGLAVTADADIGKPFARLAIQPGETAFEFIDRACRYRGVFCVADGIGGLVIVKPGTEKSKGILIYGDNILSADVSHDDSDLFSLYVVKGQAEPVGDDNDLVASVSATARVSDSNVKRYRPKVIVSENQGHDLTLAERAAWEKKVSRARAKRASYSVKGWYADAATKTLWKPNTIVTVVDERAQMFKRDMLISGVTLKRDESGTTAQLELVLPEAFDLIAENEDAAKASGTSIWVTDE